MPSYLIDAESGKVPAFGIEPVVMKLGLSALPWGLIVQDIPNIEYTGERVAAKDGDGKDLSRVYYNIDYLTASFNAYPVGTTEAVAQLVETLQKHGTMIEVTSAPKVPKLVGFWRVTSCQNVFTNTDKKMVSLALEESISKVWAP